MRTSRPTNICVRLVTMWLLVAAVAALDLTAEDTDEVASTTGRYTIEGKVYSPELLNFNSNWQKDTAVSINDGEFVGFLKQDGSFVISNVPSGSYVVDIINPEYWYESYRVEINPKGKFRARKLNFVQPSQVVQVPYPLKMKAMTRFKYFQTREQWKITDFLFSPMVLMMILPLLLMLVLPKMMNDPETRKEMENLNLNKMAGDMPDVSEMITSFFSPQKASTGQAAVAASSSSSRKEDSGKSSGKSQTKVNKKRN